MIISEKIEKWVILFMVLCLIISEVLAKNMMSGSDDKKIKKGIEKEYETILTGNELLNISIDISDKNWESLTKNALEKRYYPCDVTINGEKTENVGIRAKGDASLETVYEMGNSDRYSLMIKFDKYVNGQNFHGLQKLSLNNMISDYTQMRDAVTYDMCKYIGLPASLYSYARITKNGSYFGCYLALEPVDKVFCERNYGKPSGALYNPVEFAAEGGGGGNLNYTDGKLSNYSEIFDNAEFGSTKKSQRNVIQALKNVSEGKNIEGCVYIDDILKYMAVQSVAVNLDSLTGSAGHNNYLYLHNNKLTLIPWDFNLAFGLFVDDGNEEDEDESMDAYNSIDWENLSEEEMEKLAAEFGWEDMDIDYGKQANQYVNFPIDTPFTAPLENRQFFMIILENEVYLKKYHSYLQILAEQYINGGKLLRTMDSIHSQIGDLVGTEANAFITNDTYKLAVSEFYKLVNRRSEAVLKQLNGEFPTTHNGQLEEPEKIVEYKDIKIELTGMD